ncbi:hypothetical protein [Variovorax boronicumulans]|uniref:hypothetical protein n=2 Tax=Variovorax boronicumulans TaxID=436515 RepID=UPI0027878E15|nr:hypothetical protein [Variovorax boronicumulans]MDP9995659.1 hypothetical protein [Variovorax boronicumulans]MDQ0044525.1 hypothetical protein [Variovorax boronicumulans]
MARPAPARLDGLEPMVTATTKRAATVAAGVREDRPQVLALYERPGTRSLDGHRYVRAQLDQQAAVEVCFRMHGGQLQEFERVGILELARSCLPMQLCHRR